MKTDPDIEIIGIENQERWAALTSTGAMPSQSWRYARALLESGYEPQLACVEAAGSRLLLPFIERQWGTYTDIATIPGLSGASIIPASSAPLARWYDFAAHQGWVTGYIQLSAVSHPNVPPATPFPQETFHQNHMFLLDPGAWDLQATPSTIIRRKVAAARRMGVTIVTDRAQLSNALARLHPELMARFRAAPVVSKATAMEWAEDPANLLLGVALDGVVEAVHLMHVHGTAAEFHLAGVSRRGRELSALLHVTAIEMLRSMGVRTCNLGGGGAAGSGLHTFKRWLGARPLPLLSLRQTYHRALYESLCATAPAAGTSTWFPAYRPGPPSFTWD